MSASIRTLADGFGNEVYPKTKTAAIYDNNDNFLDDILSAKQNSTDNNLQTTAKTIVGAINEINGNSGGGGVSERLTTTKTKMPVSLKIKNWVTKTWTGLTSFDGFYVWSDGSNVYYSYSTDQYVLNKSDSTWNTKTWSGLTNFDGNRVWTDGENIYYSYNENNYVLNKETSTWSSKTWSGLSNIDGGCIWTDGDNIYYSYNTTHYVLNKSDSTWSTKTWSGLTNFYGSNIWTDGENIYYSTRGGTTIVSEQYVLNKSTSTWNRKTWDGINTRYKFGKHDVWADANNIYFSDETRQYVLNKETSTWSSKTWSGLTNFSGNHIWSDGENIYYSNSSDQYALTNKYSDRDSIGINDINNIKGQISTLTGILDYANAETITFGTTFTPTKDGVAYLYATSQAAGRAYIYIFDNAWNRIIDIIDVNASDANSAIACVTPLGKNRGYVVGGQNAINYSFVFVPYM